MSVYSGLTQVNAAVSFDSSATVTVAVGSELKLHGVTTFSDGAYTRGGLIQLNGTTTVDAPTTITIGRIDLDGEAENTQLTLDNAPLVLNVDGIDALVDLLTGGAGSIVESHAAQSVPEPTTSFLLVVGLLGLIGARHGDRRMSDR
ncbi:MAG: PEP-CTERM sorting domain-containing protein [Pirellulales bacterium]